MRVSSIFVLSFYFVAIFNFAFASQDENYGECHSYDENDECYVGNYEEYDDYEYDYEDEYADNWIDLSVDDIWEELECDEIFASPRPIHDQSTWMMLRNFYHDIVGEAQSSIAPVSDDSGVRVPVEVRHTPGKGRGVYYGEQGDEPVLPKGSLVWTTRQTAMFKDGNLYRKFLWTIPDHLACDVIQWAYVLDLTTGFDHEETEGYDVSKADVAICVDLDEGILVNAGDYSYSDTDEYAIGEKSDVSNVGCDSDAATRYQGGCRNHLFALRDIHPGEELLVAYGSFSIEEGWEYFGLM